MVSSNKGYYYSMMTSMQTYTLPWRMGHTTKYWPCSNETGWYFQTKAIITAWWHQCKLIHFLDAWDTQRNTDHVVMKLDGIFKQRLLLQQDDIYANLYTSLMHRTDNAMIPSLWCQNHVEITLLFCHVPTGEETPTVINLVLICPLSPMVQSSTDLS